MASPPPTIASMVNSASELQNVAHTKSASSTPRLQPKSWQAQIGAVRREHPRAVERRGPQRGGLLHPPVAPEEVVGVALAGPDEDVVRQDRLVEPRQQRQEEDACDQ